MDDNALRNRKLIVSDKDRKVLEPELRPGENLLWADRPRKLPISTASIFLLLFSCLWLLVVVMIILGSLTSMQVTEANMVPPGLFTELAKPVVALAFYVPVLFLLLGLLLLFSSVRLLIAPLFQIYAITDQRGIIASNLFPRRIISISSQGFKHLERTGTDKIGSIEISARQSSRNLRSAIYQVQLGSFQKIRNPQAVEALIHEQFLSGNNG